MDPMDPYDASDTSLTDISSLKKISQLRITAVYLLFLPLVMRETRSSIILTRMAKRLRKTTGDNRYRARVEDERASLTNLIFISCTRPVRKLTLRFTLILRLKAL